MKKIILISLLFSFSLQAKVYDAFMCYTGFDTVVLFGVLKKKGTLRINYYRLDTNPTEIDLVVSKYDRTDSSIIASGKHNGQEVIRIKSQYGSGKADIDLTPFLGTEDVRFQDEDIKCYFGKFED